MNRHLFLPLALVAVFPLSGCRTAATWDSAKRTVCTAKDGIATAVDAAASPFGLPGTIAGGLVKTLLNLACGSVEVATEAAKGVTANVIDVPTQAVGSVLGVTTSDPSTAAGKKP